MIKYLDVRQITGTGSSIEIDDVGYKAGKVELYNLTSNIKGVHIQGMDDGSMMKTTSSAQSVVSGGAITLTDTGYVIGTDAINANDEIIFACAYRTL